MQREHIPALLISPDTANIAELRGLLCRLESGGPAYRPLGGPAWDYFFSPYGTEGWYSWIAEMCRIIADRTADSDHRTLLEFAEKLEESAKNRAVRRHYADVSSILRLWEIVKPKVEELKLQVDAYTKKHGLKYTSRESPEKAHYTVDHYTKYILTEMRDFVKHYREGRNTVKP